MIRRAAICLALLAASACGFHLRNDLALPAEMQATYIDYRGTDANLRRTVARALALSGVTVAREPLQADALLQILNAGVSQRVLTKDFEGRPSEYEVATSLVYRVLTPDGMLLLPTQTVVRRANLLLDPAQPLANAGDIARAVQTLREDAVWDMLQQIAVAEFLPPQPADDTAAPDDAADDTLNDVIDEPVEQFE